MIENINNELQHSRVDKIVLRTISGSNIFTSISDAICTSVRLKCDVDITINGTVVPVVYLDIMKVIDLDKYFPLDKVQ